MRKIYIPIVISLITAFIGCEGKFEPVGGNSTIAEAVLLFPDDKQLCLAGEFLEQNKIRIPFSWSAVEGATGYRISAIASGSNDEVTFETTDTQANLDLEAGTMYTWQVFSLKENEESKSSSRSFYSQGALVNRYAPFPAVVSIIDDGNGLIDISWEGTDLDDDIVGYNVFLSVENPPNIYLDNTTVTSINNVGVTSAMTYYLIVETKDSLGNSSESKSSFVAK